jgi:hypothetical protein
LVGGLYGRLGSVHSRSCSQRLRHPRALGRSAIVAAVVDFGRTQMRILTLAACLIFSAYSKDGLATLIVGRQTSTEVVVGADSIEGTTTMEKVYSVCKIAQAGPVFFATFGHVGFRPTAESFFSGQIPTLARFGGSSLKRFVIANAKNFESVEHAGKILADRLLVPVAEMVDWYRMTKPDYFAEKLLNKNVNGLVLFGWQNGSPILFLLEFDAIGGMHELNVKSSLKRTDTTIAGWTIDVRHLRNDKAFWSRGAIDGVRKVIELQIQATPDKVQGPIDILQVDKTGPKWIQRKSDCPNIPAP